MKSNMEEWKRKYQHRAHFMNPEHAFYKFACTTLEQMQGRKKRYLECPIVLTIGKSTEAILKGWRTLKDMKLDGEKFSKRVCEEFDKGL